MKTPLFVCLLASGALTCAAVDTSRPKDLSFSWVDPTDPAVAAIRQTGETVNDRASHTMVYEIERAVEEKGLASAIDLVHLKQQILPKSEPGQPQVTTLKLTSLILRNPANRPDAADQAALDMVKAAIRDGTEVPAVLVQRVDRPGAPREWRVYRPISTRPICLKCHGPSQELDPEVRAKLARRYPEDKAKEYAVYTWRGLIRASLVGPEPAAAPAGK
ncbi:MAG: DUF3365 domain-containing protein [Opitutae bacterium]